MSRHFDHASSSSNSTSFCIQERCALVACTSRMEARSKKEKTIFRTLSYNYKRILREAIVGAFVLVFPLLTRHPVHLTYRTFHLRLHKI